MFRGLRVDTLLIYTILLSSIVVLADLTGYISPVKRFRALTTYPLEIATTTLAKSFTNFFSVFRQESLLNENNQLKQKNLELESKLADYEQTKTIATDIAKYANTVPSKEYKKVTSALIISNHYNDTQGLFLLAKGTRNGIQVGMPVVLGSTYVGYISESDDFSSVCTTFAIPGQQFVGYLLTRKITASIKTTLASIQLFDLLATDVVQLHDTVSVKRENYPYYFLFATISRLPEKTGSAERTAILESPLRLSDLSYVTVVQE